MDGRGKSRWKSVTPALPQANPLDVYLSYTEPPFKILFDQRVLCFTKCLKIADYFSNARPPCRGEDTCLELYSSVLAHLGHCQGLPFWFGVPSTTPP